MDQSVRERSTYGASGAGGPSVECAVALEGASGFAGRTESTSVCGGAPLPGLAISCA